MLAPPTSHPPVVAVVGSFSPVTTQQVDELAAETGVQVVRRDEAGWLAGGADLDEAIRSAGQHAARGGTVALAVAGTAPAASTRALVQGITARTDALLHAAGTLVLTGGDTARAVLDRLGVDRLEVLGELEPGICLSRAGDRFFVTKAGGFGDSHSLVRVLRHLRGTRPAGARNA